MSDEKDIESFEEAVVDNSAPSTPVSKPEGDQNNIVVASRILPGTLFIVPILQRPLFPGMIGPPIYFPDGKYARGVAHVAHNIPGKDIGIVLSRDVEVGEPQKEHLYSVGVAAKILKVTSQEEGGVHVLVNTLKRFRIERFVREDPFLIAKVVYQEDEWDKDSIEIKAMSASIIAVLRNLLKLNPLFSEQVKLLLSEININDPGKLADFACLMTTAEKEKLQEVLEAFDVKERLAKVILLLKQEEQLLAVKEKINHEIEGKVNKNQREFFLREQLKAIQKELGMQMDPRAAEIDKLKKKASRLKFSPEAADRFNEEMEKLELIDTHSPEFAVGLNYLDWIVSLPWGLFTSDSFDLRRAQAVLDREHYGLPDIKTRILEFISVSKLKGAVSGSILCFVGPPGVGKTSLGKAIAKTLRRDFFRFSLGGMRDEAEIKGHRRTYIGAMPGKIIQGLRRCKGANAVIMLDEVDKIGSSFQGDPASALLEVLDPEQNIAFLDHYLDVHFDLSKVLFIVTANVTDTIPAPLLDRMELLRLPGYILDEKLHIARRHIVPRQLREHGLGKDQVKFMPPALRAIVSDYARESGVRNMEREIANILRKCARRAGESPKKKFVIGPKEVRRLLGQPKFTDDSLMKRPVPGVVMGLAWTSNGGAVLYVEAIGIQSKEKGFKQTGQLGEVMIESSTIAYSYIASAGPARYGVPADFFANNFIHLHVPAGATPKDGPSAGVTMATSLLSLATGRVPRRNVAMTGELTLTGRVLRIGGIKEKTIAAKRAGVKTLVLPLENRGDFEEIPARVRIGIKPVFVEEFSEVAKAALGL